MPKVSTQHHLQHSSGAWDALVGYLTAITAHAASHAAGGSDALAAALAAITHPEYAESLISKHHYLLNTVGVVGNYFMGAGHAVPSDLPSIPPGPNRMFLNPCWVPRPFTPDLLAINIGGGAAEGREVRIGFYSSLTTGLPGDLVWDGGAVAVATTGIKSVVYTSQVPAGLYWLAWLANDGAIAPIYFTNVLWTLGMDSSGAIPVQRYQVSQTYGALPDPAPTSLTPTGNPLWIGFRIASVP